MGFRYVTGRLGYGRAVPWYLAGGISPANCVAAYQPKGAASYAASKINLANPGTYDATEGVAPDWDATNGWKGNGSTMYLNTQLNCAFTHSVIVRISNMNSVKGFVLNSFLAGYANFSIYHNENNKMAYSWGSLAYYVYQPGTLTEGVFAIGSNGTSYDSYYNGSLLDENREIISALFPNPYYIFARNNVGIPSAFSDVHIQAMAIYDIDILSYVSALTDAMQLL